MLSFGHGKQTSKNIADTTFELKYFECTSSWVLIIKPDPRVFRNFRIKKNLHKKNFIKPFQVKKSLSTSYLCYEVNFDKLRFARSQQTNRLFIAHVNINSLGNKFERPFGNLKFERTFMFFFLVLKYDISTTLLQILISLRFLIHLSKGVHSTRQLVFWKNKCSENFCNFTSKTSSVESFFKYTRRSPYNFLRSYLQQLFFREPVSACFSKNNPQQTPS